MKIIVLFVLVMLTGGQIYPVKLASLPEVEIARKVSGKLRSTILKEQKLELQILVDQNDEFGLFSVITDDNNNPIIIDAADIND